MATKKIPESPIYLALNMSKEQKNQREDKQQLKIDINNVKKQQETWNTAHDRTLKEAISQQNTIAKNQENLTHRVQQNQNVTQQYFIENETQHQKYKAEINEKFISLEKQNKTREQQQEKNRREILDLTTDLYTNYEATVQSCIIFSNMSTTTAG